MSTTYTDKKRLLLVLAETAVVDDVEALVGCGDRAQVLIQRHPAHCFSNFQNAPPPSRLHAERSRSRSMRPSKQNADQGRIAEKGIRSDRDKSMSPHRSRMLVTNFIEQTLWSREHFFPECIHRISFEYRVGGSRNECHAYRTASGPFCRSRESF